MLQRRHLPAIPLLGRVLDCFIPPVHHAFLLHARLLQLLQHFAVQGNTH